MKEQESKESEMILVDDPHFPNMGQMVSRKEYEAQFKKEQESKEEKRIVGVNYFAEDILEEEKQEGEEQSAEEMVEENFKGLDSLIDDKDILQFYKDLMVTCLQEYAQQSKREELIKYTDWFSKRFDEHLNENIVDEYLNPKL